MNQEQPRNTFEDLKTALAVMTVVVRALATSVEVFLHGGFGAKYLGLQALCVLLLIPLYSLFWEGYDLRPLVWFMGAYLLMCMVARIGMAIRTLRKQHEHSYYSGYPRIMIFFPRLNQTTVKSGIEPLLVFLTGVFTLPHSQPLGSYLIVAGFGLYGSVQLNLGYDRQRAQDLYDGYVEQRNVTEQFARMREDQF